jgi:hypothetical protein
MPKLPKITVVDDATAERANYVVCARVYSYDADQIVVANSYRAACALCSTPIWVAPSSPLTPPKICIPCAAALVGRH